MMIKTHSWFILGLWSTSLKNTGEYNAIALKKKNGQEPGSSPIEGIVLLWPQE